MRTVLHVTAALVLGSVVTAAQLTDKETNRITEAANVLKEIRTVPDKDIPEELWERAACVAVVPSVKKAAFVFGGEYGRGLVSCRRGSGWSAPSFLLLGKGSWGLQIGAQSIDLVLLVMNDRGIDRLLQDKVTLGGEASVAAGPIGRDARALTDAQLKAEMLSYSRTQGLFAGINLSGGVLKPDQDGNQALFGRTISARDILTTGDVLAPRAATPFITALEHLPALRTHHSHD